MGYSSTTFSSLYPHFSFPEICIAAFDTNGDELKRPVALCLRTLCFLAFYGKNDEESLRESIEIDHG